MKKLALALFAVIMLVATTAAAHAIGVSRGTYAITNDGVDATWIFRQEEAPRDLVADTHIEADGTPCPGKLDTTAPDPPDGTRVTAHFACGHQPRHLRLRADFLQRLPSGHAHVATIDGAEHLLLLAKPDVDIDLAAPPSPGFFGFVRAGVEHILTGADHLLFLLGLVLLRRDDSSKKERMKAVVFVLTAFTIGHSISLAIATLGGHAPSASIVEPLVALSVAYVGAENLFAKHTVAKRRWMITLPFGLIHGFAFASGLLLVRLPRKDLPVALVGFNLGVELGQLGVMLLVLPLLFLLARRERAYDLVRAVLSAGVLVCGLVWFVQRLL